MKSCYESMGWAGCLTSCVIVVLIFSSESCFRQFEDLFSPVVRNSELSSSFLSWQSTGAGSVSVKKAVAETEEK